MRKVVNFVPYRNNRGIIEVYVQRRSLDAPVRPNLLGLFGGGKEVNETDDETLLRETQEELRYIPVGYEYFGNYVDEVLTDKNIYSQEVDNSFEDSIVVCEGQYGIFLNAESIQENEDISPVEKTILLDIIKKYT